MITFNAMSSMVRDAVANKRQMVIDDTWYMVFLKVCIDMDLDYTAEIHDGFRLIKEWN